VKPILLFILNLVFVPILERTAKNWTYPQGGSDLEAALSAWEARPQKTTQQLRDAVIEQRKSLRQMRNCLREKNHPVTGATYTPVAQLEDQALVEAAVFHTRETLALLAQFEILEPNLLVRARFGKLEASLRCCLMMWVTPLMSAKPK
jgi:nitrogen fixation/metabolism regulation signal transduction histidine kinase